MNASLDLISARSALNGGHPEVARTLLVDIVRADPSNGPAWHLLGRAVTDPAQKADCQMRAAAAGYQAAPQELAAVAPQEPAAPAGLPFAPSFAPAASQVAFMPAAPFQPMSAPARRAPIGAGRALMMVGAGALVLILFLCAGAALLTPREIQLGGGAPVAAKAGGDQSKEAYAECVDSVGRFLEGDSATYAPLERSTVQKQGPGKYLVRGSVSYRQNGKPVSEAWNCTATMLEHGWMTAITN